MRELGIDLFRTIFQADDDTRELWSAARHDETLLALDRAFSQHD